MSTVVVFTTSQLWKKRDLELDPATLEARDEVGVCLVLDDGTLLELGTRALLRPEVIFVEESVIACNRSFREKVKVRGLWFKNVE